MHFTYWLFGSVKTQRLEAMSNSRIDKSLPVENASSETCCEIGPVDGWCPLHPSDSGVNGTSRSILRVFTLISMQAQFIRRNELQDQRYYYIIPSICLHIKSFKS